MTGADLRQMIRQLNTTVINEVQGLKRLINDQNVELRENLEEIRKSVDASHSEIVELKETNKQQERQISELQGLKQAQHRIDSVYA